jgi:phosphoglycerate dehydrogenase-like enzyme
MATADVMVGWPDPDLLAASPLRLLLLPSAGYEEYLTPPLAARQGLAVCNAGGAYSEGVAEHCVAMMLALARRLPEYLAAMPQRSWDHLHRHGRLAGSTACVIGLGTLGSAIARRCAALGMDLVGVRQHPERPNSHVSAVFGPENLGAAVADADHVIGALPGGVATRGLISREVISAIKPGAFFYNVGRGPSVDEDALIERLAIGSLAGAGLDVFATEPLSDDSPLWSMDNVIVTPHMAGYTWDYADELCAVFTANLAAHVASEPPPNMIDLSGAGS